MTDWIIAISSCVSAFVIVILWKQLTADHERARREKAAELSQWWTGRLSNRTSLSRKFAETLDFKQAKSLYNQESFEIDKSCKEMIEGCLITEGQQINFEIQNSKIRLTTKQVSQLRWEVISFLNMLKSVLTAWRHNIADREMIMEEWEYLVYPEDGHFILEQFRTAAGAKVRYPAIEEFVLEIKRKQDAKASRKGKKPIVPGS
jgi:hypothetical protein